MTEKMDKKWTTPQLIQLVRGGEEEGVLGVCKYYPIVGPSDWVNCATTKDNGSGGLDFYCCFTYSPS